VHRTSEVRSRQIVVARLENEVTVKRYRQEGSVVWLLPENPEFEPIRVDLREQPLLIEGIVVGVVRRSRTNGLMLPHALMEGAPKLARLLEHPAIWRGRGAARLEALVSGF